MSFTSLGFLGFLLAVCAVYFAAPSRVRWMVLLIANYVFYILAGARYLPYLLFTTMTTYGGGIWLGALSARYDPRLHPELDVTQRKTLKASVAGSRKAVLALVVALNLGMLAFVKYFNFLGENVNAVLNLQAVPRLDLLLPLGISFYTFQSLGYVIDVYRGRFAPERNPARLALFVSFFPQLVQGPIGRYSDLAPQLYEPHTFDLNRVKMGLQLMLWGYFKKLVIADRALVLVNQVLGNYVDYTGLYIPVIMVLSAFQLYADFSGGIDIAAGAAQALGINLAVNFRRPYFATSVADFWRRWHITLGAWMRDYLYYPLALSKGLARAGRFLRKRVNNRLGVLFPALVAEGIVFLLIGVWHGPRWTYVAFGAYYGLLVVLGLLLRPLMERLTARLGIRTSCLSWRLWQMLRTFGLTCLGRYLSRAETLGDSLAMLRLTFSRFNPWILFDGSFYKLGLNLENVLLLLAALLVLLVVSILQERGYRLRAKLAEQNLLFQWAVMLAGILAVLIFGMYGSGYDAARFIYEQF